MSSHNIIESPSCAISNPIINTEIEHFPIEDELSLSSSNLVSSSLLLALSYYLVINQIWPQLQTPYPSLLWIFCRMNKSQHCYGSETLEWQALEIIKIDKLDYLPCVSFYQQQ
jgi:hypothetical protein